MTLPDRNHVYVAVGLAVGFALGFLTARELGYDGSSRPDAAAARERPDRSLAPGDRPARGPEDAPVTIVEFTDYECPFCRRYHRRTYGRLLDAYEGEIRYVVRNFPLSSIHPHARKAAEAAACAHNQGQFWKYHDHLFENADALEEADLERYARDLGLSGPAFDRCLESGAESETVAADVAAGKRLGIRGTPTFFVNGEILVGAQRLPAFRAAVDRARRP